MDPVRVISADSHISEVEDCFRQIESKYESRRPRQTYDEKRGAVLEIADLGVKVPMGIVCTAGRDPRDFARPVRWSPTRTRARRTSRAPSSSTRRCRVRWTATSSGRLPVRPST